ncbi:TPA: hypothetical protein QCY71_005782 [Bacillus cereus]|nr:hypothetical protein [Bacillus cereus]
MYKGFADLAWYLFKPVAIAVGKDVGLDIYNNTVSIPSATNTHQSASPFSYLPSNGGGGWVTGGY